MASNQVTAQERLRVSIILRRSKDYEFGDAVARRSKVNNMLTTLYGGALSPWTHVDDERLGSNDGQVGLQSFKITLQHCRCSPWVTEAQEDGHGGQIDDLWRRLLDINSSGTLGLYMNADLVTLRPLLPAARDLQLVERSSASHYVKHVLEYDNVRGDMDKLNGHFFSRNPSKWYHEIATKVAAVAKVLELYGPELHDTAQRTVEEARKLIEEWQTAELADNPKRSTAKPDKITWNNRVDLILEKFKQAVELSPQIAARAEREMKRLDSGLGGLQTLAVLDEATVAMRMIQSVLQNDPNSLTNESMLDTLGALGLAYQHAMPLYTAVLILSDKAFAETVPGAVCTAMGTMAVATLAALIFTTGGLATLPFTLAFLTTGSIAAPVAATTGVITGFKVAAVAAGVITTIPAVKTVNKTTTWKMRKDKAKQLETRLRNLTKELEKYQFLVSMAFISRNGLDVSRNEAHRTRRMKMCREEFFNVSDGTWDDDRIVIAHLLTSATSLLRSMDRLRIDIDELGYLKPLA